MRMGYIQHGNIPIGVGGGRGGGGVGLRAIPQKCKLLKKEVVFLGRVVFEEGYKLDPSSIKPVLSLKESSPKTVNEVRKLMGFLNYYRRYIKNFSKPKPKNQSMI